MTDTKRPKKPRMILFRLLGPGLVTGAADDDPSGIATYSQAGAQFGYGLLWTGFGVGAFAGALTLTKLSQRWRPSIALPTIAVLWGALLCPLFFIRQLPLAMVFLGVAGASWAPYTPIETSLLQRLVPAEIRGQVFGARH